MLVRACVGRLRRYGGLGEILAVATPLVWGWLFSVSQQPPTWLPRVLRWGKAGHCALAGLIYLLCWRQLHFADSSTLFIDDNINVDQTMTSESKEGRGSEKADGASQVAGGCESGTE